MNRQPLFVLGAFLLLLSCSTIYGQNKAYNYVRIEDAEKILGEQAKKMECISSKEGETIKYHGSFHSIAADSIPGRTGNLYFTVEEYSDSLLSAKAYSIIKISNQRLPGFTVMHDSGNEG